jgi:hypothetical protein
MFFLEDTGRCLENRYHLSTGRFFHYGQAKKDGDFLRLYWPSILGSIFQCRVYMLFLQGWKVFNNFINIFSSGEHFQNLPNHNPGSFKGRFAMANFTISNDVLINLNFTHKIRIPSRSQDVK